MSYTLILGVGNILLQDEGIGVRVVERLQQSYLFNEEVQLLDGGTLGLNLLPYFEGVERLLIIDAMDAQKPAGTILRLTGEEIPAILQHKISPHQLGLSEVLSIARLMDSLPPQIVLLGIQPASLATSLDLSPTLAAQIPSLLQAVLQELETWGIEYRKK